MSKYAGVTPRVPRAQRLASPHQMMVVVLRHEVQPVEQSHRTAEPRVARRGGDLRLRERLQPRDERRAVRGEAREELGRRQAQRTGRWLRELKPLRGLLPAGIG